ncbi:hypothetical protein BKA64DRAFT_740907 [Cadophora sp. MPI-SDFR-AT-0126]|nr:hypothetical protein BKA64DRAFT_740907 [Leotiomycetes sp. MPI-SDFR-AT-0126]
MRIYQDSKDQDIKMSSQTDPSRSGHRRSMSTLQGVPMSIFNQQLIDEARRSSANKKRSSTSTSTEVRSSSHQRAVSVNVAASVVVRHDKSNDENDRKVRRSMSTFEPSTTKHQSTYTRPVGPELVSIKQPSCTGLPPQWSAVHDRFIAYLATHAPLDKTGRVQRKEESRERWRNEDIARLVMERFGELSGCLGTEKWDLKAVNVGFKSPRLSLSSTIDVSELVGSRRRTKHQIKVCMIENRLALLDQAGDNDYFKMPYGAYKYEKWGWGEEQFGERVDFGGKYPIVFGSEIAARFPVNSLLDILQDGNYDTSIVRYLWLEAISWETGHADDYWPSFQQRQAELRNTNVSKRTSYE